MADKKPKEKDKGSGDRDSARQSRRRRYFRRSQEPSDAPDNSPPAERASKGSGKAAAARSGRPDKSRRRRRRTRDRQLPEPELLTPAVDELKDYILPTSIFIYTHVIRPPDLRDSYEFRSDHFGRAHRQLEDFQIDLSPLFAEKPVVQSSIIDWSDDEDYEEPEDEGEEKDAPPPPDEERSQP